MWILGFLFFVIGLLWLVLKLAEAKAANTAKVELSSLSNAELVERVRDAIRRDNSVDLSTSKLREDDGYRRD